MVSGSAAAKTSNDFSGHHRQVFRVVVVKGLTLGDLPQLATEGAVGLMVPNAGPRTSQAAAFAGMVRGILYNTRLPRPHDTVLIRVTQSTEIPAHGPVIVVGLPPGTTAPNDRRYPIAVIGHGYHGLLTSSLTRVPGLVSIADVARTALQTPHALDTRRDGGPVATSYRLEDEIDVARGIDDGRLRARALPARDVRALLPARRADRARLGDRGQPRDGLVPDRRHRAARDAARPLHDRGRAVRADVLPAEDTARRRARRRCSPPTRPRC